MSHPCFSPRKVCSVPWCLHYSRNSGWSTLRISYLCATVKFAMHPISGWRQIAQCYCRFFAHVVHQSRRYDLATFGTIAQCNRTTKTTRRYTRLNSLCSCSSTAQTSRKWHILKPIRISHRIRLRNRFCWIYLLLNRPHFSGTMACLKEQLR